jgi:hypothetical protein
MTEVMEMQRRGSFPKGFLAVFMSADIAIEKLSNPRQQAPGWFDSVVLPVADRVLCRADYRRHVLLMESQIPPPYSEAVSQCLKAQRIRGRLWFLGLCFPVTKGNAGVPLRRLE